MIERDSSRHEVRPPDNKLDVEIGQVVTFVLSIPSARRRIDIVTTEMERIEGFGRLGSARKYIHQALRLQDGAKLRELAQDPNQPVYEIMSKVAQSSPVLKDLILVPGERNYSHIGMPAKAQEKFSSERSFLTGLLDQVPEAKVFDYLRKFIDKIEFRHPVFTSLGPQRRQEILLFIFKEHLVRGNSFSWIREKFFRQPFSFSEFNFPGEISLANYYSALIFALAEKWPEIAKKYSLKFRAESEKTGRVALENLRVDEATNRYLEDVLKKAPPVDKLVIQTLLEGKLPLLPFAQKYPYLTRFFSTIVKGWVKAGREYLPAKELSRVIKYWLFSENIWLLPEGRPKGKVKSNPPHKVFQKLLLTVKQGKFENSAKKRPNRIRILALQGLGKYVGRKGIEIFLASLPNKPVGEKLEMVEKLRSDASSKSGLRETTIDVYSREIAATICDIMDGRKVPDLLLMKGEKRGRK